MDDPEIFIWISIRWGAAPKKFVASMTNFGSKG
jgi:hypothetical protein